VQYGTWTGRNVGVMRIGKTKKAWTVKECGVYGDTHSLADVWDKTEPATFSLSTDFGSRHWVSVDPELLDRIHGIASKRGLRTESLVNLLLERQLQDVTA
jgi:hypothetical protein